MKSSWRTTVAGILQFLAITATQIGFLFDEVELNTNPDWGLVVASLITLIGMIVARDNLVSSEEAQGLA